MLKITALSLFCLALAGCASNQPSQSAQATPAVTQADAQSKREWKLNDYTRTDQPYATASMAFKECINGDPTPTDDRVGYCEGIGLMEAYKYFRTPAASE